MARRPAAARTASPAAIQASDQTSVSVKRKSGLHPGEQDHEPDGGQQHEGPEKRPTDAANPNRVGQGGSAHQRFGGHDHTQQDEEHGRDKSRGGHGSSADTAAARAGWSRRTRRTSTTVAARVPKHRTVTSARVTTARSGPTPPAACAVVSQPADHPRLAADLPHQPAAHQGEQTPGERGGQVPQHSCAFERSVGTPRQRRPGRDPDHHGADHDHGRGRPDDPAGRKPITGAVLLSQHPGDRAPGRGVAEERGGLGRLGQPQVADALETGHDRDHPTDGSDTGAEPQRGHLGIVWFAWFWLVRFGPARSGPGGGAAKSAGAARRDRGPADQTRGTGDVRKRDPQRGSGEQGGEVGEHQLTGADRIALRFLQEAVGDQGPELGEHGRADQAPGDREVQARRQHTPAEGRDGELQPGREIGGQGRTRAGLGGSTDRLRRIDTSQL